jgi:hypothetical protein
MMMQASHVSIVVAPNVKPVAASHAKFTGELFCLLIPFTSVA